jgi:hypothetical protein
VERFAGIIRLHIAKCCRGRYEETSSKYAEGIQEISIRAEGSTSKSIAYFKTKDIIYQIKLSKSARRKRSGDADSDIACDAI